MARTRQPQGPVRIIPRYADATVAINFAQLRNQGTIGTCQPILTGGATQRPNVGGIGAGPPDANGGYIALGTTAATQLNTQSGVICWVPTTTSAVAALFNSSFTAGANGFAINQLANGTVELSKHNTAAIVTTTNAANNNAVNTLAWSYTTAGTATVVLNGVVTSANSAQSLTHGDAVLGKYRSGDNAFCIAVLFNLFVLWPKTRSATELSYLCENPWSVFSSPRRLWVQLGATGGTGTTGIGSSTGTSTVTAAGQSLAETIGSIAGVSTALAVGQSLWDALGQSTGTSTVSGEGLTDSSSIGSSTGESTVLGVSSSLWETIGASTGTTLVTAVGQSLFEAIGEATGTSTVLGVDGSILISGAATGLSDGTSTVGGVGSSLWSASGSSSGIATVAGLLEAFFEATGSSVGTSTVAGVGSTPSTGTGTLDQATIDAIATAVWAQILDAGLSAEGLLRIIAAHAAGSATGLENGSPVFKSLDGTKDRITGTYAAGTRTVTGRDAT